MDFTLLLLDGTVGEVEGMNVKNTPKIKKMKHIFNYILRVKW